MNKVQVSGIGIISRMGTTIEEVWNYLNSETVVKNKAKVEYMSLLPVKKQRRMNRYSDMTVYVSYKALEDAQMTMEDLNVYRIGTIFSTGYGPMESNLSFADMVLKDDPDLCSPTVFANTVSNACVGHVCMNLGCKGVSTIVMGSNSVGYSQMLIDKGDADYILSGSVEECNATLYQCFRKNPFSENVDIAEAAVGLLLSKEEKKDDYCQLVDFFEYNLGDYPLINKYENKNTEPIKAALKNFLGKGGIQIDAVFSAANGSYFDQYETDILREVLGEQIIYVDLLKKYAGETLGSSISMTIAVAAVCLKKGSIPWQLISKKEKGTENSPVKTILATGYDVTGNYVAYLMKR